ncbi:MAG: alanine racemase [Myxococcota bacterium]
MLTIRPTRVEIDLDAIAHNLRVVREAASGRKLCCVIKADGYGHGGVPIAKTLARSGVDWLAVALIEEGVELRAAGVTVPILVLGGALEGGYRALFEHQLTPVIFHDAHLRGLARAAGGRQIAVHLKVDTGMARLGVSLTELGALLTRIKNEPAVRLDGVMTHFANADEQDIETNQRQTDLFRSALQKIRSTGFTPAHVHASNSAATQTFDDELGTMVRPGLMLFGVEPIRSDSSTLQPVLKWVTSPVQVKSIPAGTAVSYGGRWVAKRQSTIATLPVGYADGYPRALSNRADVLVNGARAPVVGSVCMDMCMVDVTDCGPVSVGDEVVLLGAQGPDVIDADELADHAETLAYEILTGVQKRVPRVYRGALAGEVAA